jgi:hypothetical protein
MSISFSRAQEDDEEDELVDASDAEEPADAPVIQTAKAEAGADATADDQPGAQLTASAPVTADDGFLWLPPKLKSGIVEGMCELPHTQA